mgnify:CR=1 FL=1
MSAETSPRPDFDALPALRQPPGQPQKRSRQRRRDNPASSAHTASKTNQIRLHAGIARPRKVQSTLAHSPEPGVTAASRKRAVRASVVAVSDYLGNTPAIAKASYIDPRVIDLYESGTTIAASAGADYPSADERQAALANRYAADFAQTFLEITHTKAVGNLS